MDLKSVRTLAVRDGLAFVEGVKPGDSRRRIGMSAPFQPGDSYPPR